MDDPRTLLKQALAAEAGQRIEESEELLARAAQLAPSEATLIALARVQLKRERFAAAGKTFEQLIALTPDNPSPYLFLAKARDALDDEAGRRKVLLSARQRFPLDPVIARASAGLDDAVEAQSIADMKRALQMVADAPSKATPILRFLTETQARTARRDAGLPPSSALSWDDTIRWADLEGMEALAASLDRELALLGFMPETAVERGAAAMANQDWATAETWFARAREHETGTVSDVVTIDPVFFHGLEEMTDKEIAAPFPPVIDVIPRMPAPRVIYLASDPRYFELFTLPLLDSLEEWQAAAAVHVHLLDGNPQEWRRLAASLAKFDRLQPSMSAEESSAKERLGEKAPNYYHAVRFVRFYQFLAKRSRPAWIMDVDMKIGADPNPILRLLDTHEIVVHGMPLGIMPWHKIGGDLVGIAPTAAGLGYAKLVGAYISHWHARRGLRWFIDQFALFASYLYLVGTGGAPKTIFATNVDRDDRDPEPSAFRAFHGRRKFARVAAPMK